MLSRFHLIPERYGQTDGQTEGRTDLLSISRVIMLTRDKTDFTFWLIFGLSPNLGLEQRKSQRKTDPNSEMTHYAA